MKLNYPVVGYVKIRGSLELPLLDIPMMSDAEWNQLAAAQAVKHFREQNGRDPESTEEALQWQREWIAKEGL